MAELTDKVRGAEEPGGEFQWSYSCQNCSYSEIRTIRETDSKCPECGHFYGKPIPST